MKVTLGVKELKNILDLCTKFVAKNNTLPILQNIYIHGKGSTITWKATDMEKYIEISLDANVEGEGALTVDAKTFSDIIRSNDDEFIDLYIDLEKESMTIKSVYDTFSIKGINANEYVALPEMNATQQVDILANTFAQGIEKVEYAVTEKVFSPIFTGVLIKTKKEEEKNTIVFVGTDSFRLAEYKVTLDKDISEEMSLIIPKTSVNDIKSIAQYASQIDKETSMTLHLAKNLVRCSFALENMKIQATSLLIQGTFPDYDNEKIMPRSFNSSITFNKASCDKAIKKIGILTRDLDNYIQLQVQGESVTVSSGETDRGDGAIQLQAKNSGGDMSLGLNGKHISDFLRTIEGEDVVFNIVNEQAPLVLSKPDDYSYRYVIRPTNR